MNKKLIRKYKAEFEYWLNGGRILVKYADPKQVAPGYTDWHEDELIWESNLNYLIIMDDEYAIYRKALAEGKTVQEQDYYSKQWLNMKTDNFHGASDTQYEGIYRIKPEEPKFKVGNWVTQAGSKPFRLSEDTCYLGLTKWEPQPGEICIFWDNTINCAKISKFLHMKHIIYFVDKEDTSWQNCMPFTGELPPNIKN